MHVRDRILGRFASQLGRPRGLGGRFVGAVLNRRNRGAMATAVAELSPSAEATVADIGFGGGAGLGLLLRRLGPAGQVHGVELSGTMLSHAACRFRRAVAAHRLRLHTGSMAELPLATGSLDGIITLNTVYYVADLDHAFGEIARVLTASGGVVIGIADPTTMAQHSFSHHGLVLRSVSEILARLESAQLTVEHHREISVGRDTFHLLAATASASGSR